MGAQEDAGLAGREPGGVVLEEDLGGVLALEGRVVLEEAPVHVAPGDAVLVVLDAALVTTGGQHLPEDLVGAFHRLNMDLVVVGVHEVLVVVDGEVLEAQGAEAVVGGVAVREDPGGRAPVDPPDDEGLESGTVPREAEERNDEGVLAVGVKKEERL